MRYVAFIAALLAGLLTMQSIAFAGDVYVRGHYRSNGTYVQPHYRTAPDGNVWNNYSTQGNINPYTGRAGTVNPYAPTTTPYGGSPYPYGLNSLNALRYDSQRRY